MKQSLKCQRQRAQRQANIKKAGDRIVRSPADETVNYKRLLNVASFTKITVIIGLGKEFAVVVAMNRVARSTFHCGVAD